MVDQAKAREAAGDDFGALARYDDALRVSPDDEAAHLGIARLRARRGELAKALDILDLGLARRPRSIELAVERARVRRLASDFDGAAIDLDRAARAAGHGGLELLVLREKTQLDRETRAFAALLGDWRRLAAIARETVDEPLRKEADIQVRALSLYVGEIDPVLGGRKSLDPMRKGLASIAKRAP